MTLSQTHLYYFQAETKEFCLDPNHLTFEETGVFFSLGEKACHFSGLNLLALHTCW